MFHFQYKDKDFPIHALGYFQLFVVVVFSVTMLGWHKKNGERTCKPWHEFRISPYFYPVCRHLLFLFLITSSVSPNVCLSLHSLQPKRFFLTLPSLLMHRRLARRRYGVNKYCTYAHFPVPIMYETALRLLMIKQRSVPTRIIFVHAIQTE